MTSGKFKSFPIDKITINREERQRRELDRIDELAASIRRVGLIHPPVLSRDGVLHVGERRVAACRSLGWTHIPVQFIEEMNEAELQLLELEENVRRVDLHWHDQCRAVEKYHRLRSADEESWTEQKTADALGLTQANVNEKITVARELNKGHARIVEAPKYSVALGIVRREQERKRDSIIEKLADSSKDKVVPLLFDDFAAWQSSYTGPKFNFIHCDFPYGVNADKHDQGAGAAMGGYEDTPELYFELIETLTEAMTNAIADSAHLMFWFSMDYYEDTLSRLEVMGWRVNPFPLVWHKSDNAGILPDPSRGPRRVYETAFIASRGDRKIVQPVSNLVASPTTKLIHMSEKPEPVLRHFFRMFVDEYSVVLDPTCGSANAVKVAKKMGAAHVLGIENNREFFELASAHFYDEPELV